MNRADIAFSVVCILVISLIAAIIATSFRDTKAQAACTAAGGHWSHHENACLQIIKLPVQKVRFTV